MTTTDHKEPFPAQNQHTNRGTIAQTELPQLCSEKNTISHNFIEDIF
jgi:hypothetical protein